jgi:ATP-binding cassette subfamily B multidrug efflux pump
MLQRRAALPAGDDFTAAIGAFEALLFSMMAHVVDLLAKVQPAQLWVEHGHTMKLLAGVLVASVLFVALQALFKYQGVFSNFPMRRVGISTA